MTSIINAYAIVDFVTGHLPALSSGFIGGLLAEPVKAWFIEPLKAKALARQRTRTMRTDLYRGLARDMALLKRVEEMSELTEWPTHLRQIGGEQQESTPRTALEHWLNGRLLEDLSTETFDDWRKTYPTECPASAGNGEGVLSLR